MRVFTPLALFQCFLNEFDEKLKSASTEIVCSCHLSKGKGKKKAAGKAPHISMDQAQKSMEGIGENQSFGALVESKINKCQFSSTVFAKFQCD